jgi:hypothetical protein
MNDLAPLSGTGFVLTAIALCAVIAAGWTCWHYRRQFVRPVAAVTGALVLLVVLTLASRQTVSVILEPAISRLFAVWCLFVITWVFLAMVCPRIPNRDRAFAPLLLGIPLALGFVGGGLGLWAAADDGLRLQHVPVIRSEANALAVWDGPHSNRLYGVLVEGVAGNPDVAREHHEAGLAELMWYESQAFVFSDSSSYTGPFNIRLADGHDIEVQAPVGPRVAWDWPQSRRHAFRSAIQDSDPVVLWSDVARQRSLITGLDSASFTAPRIIAHGTLADFRQSFMPRALLTGRLIAVAALAMVPAALLTLLVSVFWWRRIRRHGSDAVSAPITITTGDGKIISLTSGTANSEPQPRPSKRK